MDKDKPAEQDAEALIDDQLPQSGGTYTRQPDGTLTKAAPDETETTPKE